MEYRVEKFQMSPCCTASTLPRSAGSLEQRHVCKSSKPIAPLREKSNQLELLSTELQKKDRPASRETEEDGANVALNLCPDGSEINININGTRLTATKTSLNATIGNFNISINCCNDACKLIKEDTPIPQPPPVPSSVALVTTQGNPLHIVLGDSPDVKATLSLSKFNC